MTPTPKPPGQRDRAARRWITEKQKAPQLYAPHSISSRAVTQAQRLRRYRAALDTWDRMLGSYPLPQPRAYGLDLPDLRPSEVVL